MIAVDFSTIKLKLKKEGNTTLVFDPVRKKWPVLTEEEHVRQYMIAYLVSVLNYPVSLLSVEKKIRVGNMDKRFDIVVYDRAHMPWMLIECKAPHIIISDTVLHQLLQYQNKMQCRYWVLTNGHQTFCADAADISRVSWLNELPLYDL